PRQRLGPRPGADRRLRPRTLTATAAAARRGVTRIGRLSPQRGRRRLSRRLSPGSRTPHRTIAVAPRSLRRRCPETTPGRCTTETAAATVGLRPLTPTISVPPSRLRDGVPAGGRILRLRDPAPQYSLRGVASLAAGQPTLPRHPALLPRTVKAMSLLSRDGRAVRVRHEAPPLARRTDRPR